METMTGQGEWQQYNRLGQQFRLAGFFKKGSHIREKVPHRQPRLFCVASSIQPLLSHHLIKMACFVVRIDFISVVIPLKDTGYRKVQRLFFFFINNKKFSFFLKLKGAFFPAYNFGFENIVPLYRSFKIQGEEKLAFQPTFYFIICKRFFKSISLLNQEKLEKRLKIYRTDIMYNLKPFSLLK